jgi:hypothetical protein
MNPILKIALDLVVLIGCGVAIYNCVLIIKGQDRYLLSAIGGFVMGGAAAFSYQWFIAGTAAFLILFLALHRWLIGRF